MYMTPKDDYVEKPAAGIVAEDSKEKLAAGNSDILGSKERVLTKENTSDTKGSVVEKESMDSAHELSSAATYAINNNVQSKSDESKSNEIETSTESKRNVDRSDTEAAVDRQRETRKEQEPEPVPEPEMEMGSSLDMAKENDSIDDNKANDNVKTEDTNTSQEHDLASKATAVPATPVVDEQQLKNWKKNINMVWRDLSGHRFGSMFINPIKSADAPNYYDIIRKPMDLKTIKNRVRDEEITTTVEFYRDIMHMLMNALMYNSEDTEVYQMAMEFIPDARACIEQLLQTEEAVKHPESSGGDVESTCK
ncbi:hypothetical protein EV175_002041 [Coemansia sp. RSA 1933]|nr:hypothetical protein EV175_002041 [Coemansia sp. RSA 1933]